MRKLYRFLLRLKFWQYVLMFFIINLALNFAWGQMPFTDYSNPEADAIEGFAAQFVMGVLLVPFVETLACQAMPVGCGCIIFKHWQLGRFRFRLYAWPLMLFSAAIFALNHSFHWSYMVMTFVVGISLAFSYYVARKRKPGGIVTVGIIHACMNLTVLLLETFNI